MALFISRSLILALLLCSAASGAELVISHPASAEPGELVTITVFGDPMGSIDIAYQIPIFATEGDLSIVSWITPAPFSPSNFAGTCGVVANDLCIASGGISQPFADTFPATTLATLALDTTGIAPGTVVFIRIGSTGYDFFGADDPLPQTIEIGTAPVPSLNPGGWALLAALLIASTVFVRGRVPR